MRMPANLVNSIVASRPQGASSARGGGGEAQPYCTSHCGEDGVEGFANIGNNVCSDFLGFATSGSTIFLLLASLKNYALHFQCVVLVSSSCTHSVCLLCLSCWRESVLCVISYKYFASHPHNVCPGCLVSM